MTAAQKLSLRLLFLPFLLAAFDAIATLYYQPGDYWNGNYNDASDGNPIVLIALRINPLLIIPGTLGWLIITWFLICHTAAWIALRSYVILIIGHTIGGCGWLLRYHSHGAELYAVIATVVLLIASWVIYPFLRHWSAEGTLRAMSLLGKTDVQENPRSIQTA